MKLSDGSSFYVECVLMAWQRVVDAPPHPGRIQEEQQLF